MDASKIALTGTIAIGVHLDATDGEPLRAFAAGDIDLVADGVDAVPPTVASEFLLSHFHLPHAGYGKFMVQLVDPVTRLRLDVFPDALGALPRASIVEVAGLPLRVVDAEDILEHKLTLLSQASAANPVEAKHYADAKRLGAFCRRDVPILVDAQLTSTAYSQNLDEICVRCESSRRPDFPLAAKQAIFDVLGYV